MDVLCTISKNTNFSFLKRRWISEQKTDQKIHQIASDLQAKSKSTKCIGFEITNHEKYFKSWFEILCQILLITISLYLSILSLVFVSIWISGQLVLPVSVLLRAVRVK